MKPRVREAIAVEGRYDGHAVRAAVDAPVVELGGFRIFKSAATRRLLVQYAAARGLIILTDSDRAGSLLRRRLKDEVPPERVKNAYVPRVSGKERRKPKPGAENVLGVEAFGAEEIIAALRRAGAHFEDGETESFAPLTRAELYEHGFSGGSNSSLRRAELLRALGLPDFLSAKALCEAVNSLELRQKYDEYVKDSGKKL